LAFTKVEPQRVKKSEVKQGKLKPTDLRRRKMNRKASPKKGYIVIMLAFLIITGKHAYADFTFSTPIKVPNINISSVEVANPEISSDGLSLYFSPGPSGGYGSSDIWMSTRETKDDDWSTPMNLGPPINSSACEGQPSISADGLELYFADGSYSTPGPYRPGGYGGSDIWISRRATTNDPWTEPVNLGRIVNSSASDSDPEISADGLSLFFNSECPGGYGNVDLWVTTRPTKESPWIEPVNLGPILNNVHYDGDPDISPDGLSLFFGSHGDLTGYGSLDLWLSRRATINDPWAKPVNLGPIVNSVYQDADPTISPDGSILYFASPRSGYWEIWQVSIEPKLDFNGDLKIDLEDMHIMVDHWGENYPLCDIGPTPLGDGIVNVDDIKVLDEHLYRLIAHWELDEADGNIAYDSIGKNHGICYGEPFWQPTIGMINGALFFDGADDYVNTPFILDPSKGPFSVFAWIFGGSPGQVIISQIDSDAAGKTWLGTDAIGGNLMTGLVPKKIGWITPQPLVSESVITDIQWHHVGLVWDGSYRALYVDGLEVAKDKNAQDLLNSSEGGLYVGASKDLSTGTLFSGLIDDVRIYKQALTTDEIAVLAQ
jgi:Tol biopolymer transport system component